MPGVNKRDMLKLNRTFYCPINITGIANCFGEQLTVKYDSIYKIISAGLFQILTRSSTIKGLCSELVTTCPGNEVRINKTTVFVIV